MKPFTEATWAASVERHMNKARPETERFESVVSTKLDNDLLLNTNLRSRRFADRASLIAYARPKWEIAALPYLVIDPTPTLETAVHTGDFILWPERAQKQPEANRDDLRLVARRPIDILDPGRIIILPQRQAFFALAVPRLLDLTLTVEQVAQPNGGVRISGGTAVLTVGVYAEEGAQVIERYRAGWVTALQRAGQGDYLWKFQPVVLRDLRAALELPQQHLAAPPQVAVNAGAGTATFVVQLTEPGVLLWKAALDQGNAGALPGVCRITAGYYAYTGEKVVTRTQDMSAALGILMVGRGPSDVSVINPQQTVEAHLVVSGHDLIQSVVVSLRPNSGQAPVDQIFDRRGGQVDLAITTQNVAAVEVVWDARVTFTPSGWPVIPTVGSLSNAVGWSDLIKPDSWVAQYTFMAILVDAAGNPVALSAAGSNYHVKGVLTFTAPYVPATGVLVSAFDMSNQQPVNVALPRFPGRPLGDLLINVFATRDGKAGTQTRPLAANELAVVVKVFPDARMQIVTGSDALTESSELATVFADLERLNR